MLEWPCLLALDAEQTSVREAAKQVLLHSLKDKSRQEVQIHGFSSLLGALLKNCARNLDGVERWAGAEEPVFCGMAPSPGCMVAGPPSSLGEGSLNSPSIIWRKSSLWFGVLLPLQGLLALMALGRMLSPRREGGLSFPPLLLTSFCGHGFQLVCSQRTMAGSQAPGALSL